MQQNDKALVTENQSKNNLKKPSPVQSKPHFQEAKLQIVRMGFEYDASNSRTPT